MRMTKFNFDDILQKAKHIDLSLSLGNTAKNEFLDNFKKESFDSQSWNKRKKETRKSKGKKILVNTGRLRKDVANAVQNGIKNSNKSFTLVVKNNYAGYLNEGTDRMQKRKFVGTTLELNKKLLLKIKQNYDKLWEI